MANQTELQNITGSFKAAVNAQSGLFKNGSIVKANVVTAQYTTYSRFLDTYTSGFLTLNETVGVGARLTSRLIPTEMFQTEDGLTAIATGLTNASTALGIENAILPIQGTSEQHLSHSKFSSQV